MRKATSRDGTWNMDTIDEELNRVDIFNFALVGSQQSSGLMHRDALWVNWREVPVPEGLAPLAAMTFQEMQSAGLTQKLLEGPPGYRLYEICIRHDDDLDAHPYWVNSHSP